MGTQQQFCLRWNNHQTNLLSVFDQLLQSESFVDVTLACDGLSLKAHKVVLSACSPFFQKLLLDNPCQHPIVILNNVQYSHLKALVDFMYKGEVSVFQDQLSALLHAAETLKIKGLSEVAPAGSGMAEVKESPTANAVGTSVTAVVSTPAQTSRKRKRFRSHQKPSTGSACSSDSDGSVLDASVSRSPEMIEAKVDVQDDSGMLRLDTGQLRKSTLITLTSVSPPCNNESPTATVSSNDIQQQQHVAAAKITRQGEAPDCRPEPRIHEGFSQQENEEPQNPSLDSSNFLGLSSFPSGPSHQFQNQMTLPCLSQASSHNVSQDAAMDSGNKSGATAESSSSSSAVAATPTPNSSSNSGGGNRGISPFDAQPKDCIGVDVDLRGGGGSHWSSTDVETIRNGRFLPSNGPLWQRAKREVLDTPKRDCLSAANWTEDSLLQALEAVRSGRMSITRAAVSFGIPNSTLWQRSRREGIDTSRNGPFAHQSSWTESNLAQALDAVRAGRMSVNKASATFGIPSTTLWSRAKRYGIETSRRGGAYEHEREEVMWHALQAVKAGVISMTQASIKYNVPYTTLWKHFKKWEMTGGPLTLPLSMSTPPPASSIGMGMHHVTSSLHSHPIDSIVTDQSVATSSIAS